MKLLRTEIGRKLFGILALTLSTASSWAIVVDTDSSSGQGTAEPEPEPGNTPETEKLVTDNWSQLTLLIDAHKQLLQQLATPLHQSNKLKDGWHLISDLSGIRTQHKNLLSIKATEQNFMLGGYYARRSILLGGFIGGALHQHQLASYKNALSLNDHNNPRQHHQLISAGVFSRWQIKSCYIATSARLGAVQAKIKNNNKNDASGTTSSTSASINALNHTYARSALSLHGEAGYDYHWSNQLGINLYTSCLYSHIGADRLKHQTLSSTITKTGLQLHYSPLCDGGQNRTACAANLPSANQTATGYNTHRTSLKRFHTIYFGGAYERELNHHFRNCLGQRFGHLAASNALLEAGYCLQHGDSKIQLATSASLGKSPQRTLTLAFCYTPSI